MMKGKLLHGCTDDLSDCFKIRHEVFVIEQNVSQEEEYDGLDESCEHYIVYTDNDIPVCTGRLIKISDEVYKIGRVATLKAYRKQGYAEFLMKALMDEVRRLGGRQIILTAQLHAEKFYEKCGFYVDNDEIIIDAGIEHHHMTYNVID